MIVVRQRLAVDKRRRSESRAGALISVNCPDTTFSAYIMLFLFAVLIGKSYLAYGNYFLVGGTCVLNCFESLQPSSLAFSVNHRSRGLNHA